MTLSEALSTGVQVTVTGLAIVFSVLIILMLVMMLMKKVFYKEAEPQKKAAPAPVPAAPKAAAPEEDPNLIAVLTAAVAASLNTSTYNLNIKSYKRVGGNAPAWNKAGIRDTIDSRF